MSPDEQKLKQDDRKFDLIIELRILQQRLDDFQSGTREYRQELNTKINTLFSKIDKLPCRERSGWYSMANLQFKALWIIVGVTLGTIVGEWFKK